MAEKKSKFSSSNVAEDNKGTDRDVKTPPKEHGAHHLKEGKKNFDLLQVHIARPNEIHKWQETRVSTNLPERRSHLCSCIYKGRYS